MKKILLFSLTTILALTVKAQDLAMVNTSNITANYSNNTDYEIVPLIEEAEYTYKYQGNDVLVTFKDDEHVEYFNNKKHFIKSTVEWISKDECYMTIKESNLPDFPFRKGTKLQMKILKIKKEKVYYESTLGGRSWSGKMRVKETN